MMNTTESRNSGPTQMTLHFDRVARVRDVDLDECRKQHHRREDGEKTPAPVSTP